jgi:hypothetical protein
MRAWTSSNALRAALFTLVPIAYLSIVFWRPDAAHGRFGREGMPSFCTILMAAVFVVSLLSWNKNRIVAVFGLLACLLWVAVYLLPVL